ncbi:hypothetical protein SAMN05192534_12436 [Alteribacillus persepolensis]|uniref:Phage protein n=1 Tax=Alteribacillus persepolensis TaxID=568899 RepID=A0A1G8IIY1_9BACI|nr:hypothetical protein [Alteribacillus persepolensis]SDI18721.1 hypothetical protein SAMN05192534_12436 [Alteribacillus persepolensis]
MKPSFQEQLAVAAKQLNLEPKRKRKRKKGKKKSTEQYSESEIKELMGMNRRTYGRGRGGAIRQK